MRLLPRADFAPLGELAAHRQRLWAQAREYVKECSAFYREIWTGYDVPESLDDLAALPLVDKETLRASQREHPPFGAYLAAAVDEVRRVHRTGGTTGEAMNLALSAADAEEIGRASCRERV